MNCLVPLKNDIWLAAFMFDPYYTPNNTECDVILGIYWMKSMCELLAIFYKSVQLENTVLEVNVLVQQKGYWGDEIKGRNPIKPP